MNLPIRIFFTALTITLLFTWDIKAEQFIPPLDIVSKQSFPIKIEKLNFIRTKKGITYLISEDGRYVFQGAFFDVWNGKQIQSMTEMKNLADVMDMEYLGVDSEKMFSLDMGTGENIVLIFSDPNCPACHNLADKILNSGTILKNFTIKLIIVPFLSEGSMGKAKKLATIAAKDKNKAIKVFTDNSYADIEITENDFPKLNYNIMIAKALSIKNFPYIINSKGEIHIGIPNDIYSFFLLN